MHKFFYFLLLFLIAVISLKLRRKTAYYPPVLSFMWWDKHLQFSILVSLGFCLFLFCFVFSFWKEGWTPPVSMLLCRMSMWHTYVSHKDQHGQVLREGHPGAMSGVSQSWRAKVYSIRLYVLTFLWNLPRPRVSPSAVRLDGGDPTSINILA